MPLTEESEKTEKEFTLLQLLPNAMTIAAICAGLSALRFGIQGNITLAVYLVLLAGILDGLDGRVARLLGSDSKMGAELDSLADFLNFGVVPPLLLYFWALSDIPGPAWVAVLIFTVCCVIRLARFNVAAKSEVKAQESAYFVGVPSPAGALLVMLPIYVSFASDSAMIMPATAICIYMVFIGYLMICRTPTWSFKTVTISGANVKYFLVAVAAAGAALFTFSWTSLIVLCIGYIVSVLWSLLRKEIFTRL